jgi:tRNA (cytidine/uridine-2'-O-)-methyltransferase
MRLALYQPEIPQNVGTLIRLGACVGVSIDIIEPTGFVWSDKHLKRAGMDYADLVNVERFESWDVYENLRASQRIVLLDTKAEQSYWDFTFKPDDILMVGRESSGVPEDVYQSIPNRVRIPMLPDRRSLNMAIAGAMVLAESLRQLNHDHSTPLC